MGSAGWNIHVACFLYLMLGSFLQTASAQTSSKLGIEIERLKSDTDLAHATWSLCVKDIKKDSVVAEFNSRASLVPASSLKIITTASALALLGPMYKYETILEYDGKLDTSKGLLQGNLYIKGSGDPTLGSQTFKKKSDTVPLTDLWAKILISKGIKKIEGAVIGDAVSFEDEIVPYSWIWGDMGNYYGAGATGLNFADNKFTLYFRSGSKKGDSTFITKISPEIPGMKVFNQTISKGYADNAYIYGAPYTLVRYVKGAIPVGKKDYEVEGSAPDPPLHCAQALDSSLRKAGVSISKNPSTLRNYLPPADAFTITTPDTSPPGAPNGAHPALLAEERRDVTGRKKIYVHTSHTLEKIIYETNLQSNNLFAESLLKTIAFKKTKFGEDQTGMDIIYNYWKLKGVELKGFHMADGSGLSRLNAITTLQQTDILCAIYKDSVLFKKFYDCLPIAGKSGSLGKLCKGTAAENNLRAKSGYMTRIRSYAGYVTSKKGRLLAFSIIVNNYDCTPGQMKDKLEKLMVAIAETE